MIARKSIMLGLKRYKFLQLLEKENTFTIHQENLKKRAIEIYKEKHKITNIDL